MKVSKSDTLAGHPLIKVRDLLRPYRQGAITAKDVETVLGVSVTEAEAVLQAMIAAGFIEPKSEQRADETDLLFTVTDLGSRLCVARFVKRITREKADALVRDMLERVTEINGRDELVLRVKRVRAFGSYAGDAPEVGDIDLAVDWGERYPDRDIVEQSLARADASGKSLNTYMARLSYGETEVERLLKGRSPYISIQRGDFPEKFAVPAIVLFAAE
ncbi:putative nucleotidyltransferase [Bradyrhizobium sp. GM24.11]